MCGKGGKTVDFSKIKAEIAKYDTLHAALPAGSICMGAQALSRELAQMIAGHLNRREDDFITAHRDDLTYFCQKMVEFSPYYSSRRVLRGQFLVKLGQFPEAMASFHEAYEIEKDTHYAWPHLQKREDTARILIWYGYALYHTGQEDEGRRYFEAGHAMDRRLKAGQEDKSSPKPPEPR